MGFTFKQFHIDDDNCAMKVGTDSVLLGALVDCCGARQILDIGCGSGLLGLMLVQRCGPEVAVTALDIDAKACRQAKDNVAASPWPHAVDVLHSDINRFDAAERFDLVISNPPYFNDSLKAPDKARNLARHTVGLTHRQLAENVSRLITDNGTFWLILPPDAAALFCAQAGEFGLHLHRLVYVHTKKGKPAHRQILALGRTHPVHVEHSTLDIYDENNRYSSQFIALTREFYLNR